MIKNQKERRIESDFDLDLIDSKSEFHYQRADDADPKFDRKRMLFLYPNGVEQKAVLNLHLK